MSNGRAWSSDEISKLRRLVASGLTDAQIGEDMDRDKEVVRRKRVCLDLEPGQISGMRYVLRKVRARQMARARV